VSDDVDVIVAVAVFDVGRAGALKLPVLLVSGHTSRPHARSVGQQPPPREAGQDLNPEEQTKVLGMVEVLEGGFVGVGDGEDVVEGLALELDEGGGGGGTTVVSVMVDGGGGRLDELELEEEVDVGVGVRMTTAVEVAMQPTSRQAYPGRQHPPF